MPNTHLYKEKRLSFTAFYQGTGLFNKFTQQLICKLKLIDFLTIDLQCLSTTVLHFDIALH